jgi:hypothetical protein
LGGGDINFGATPTAHEPEPSLARTSFMLHTHRFEALKAHTSSDNTTIPACINVMIGKTARKGFREHCRVRQRGRYMRVLPSLDASENI